MTYYSCWKKSIEERSKEVALQKKLELKEELTKELVTKAEFYGEIGLLRQEIRTLRVELEGKIENTRTELEAKIENVKRELEAKIEKEILRLDRKFTIMFLILLFAIIFLNKDALEFIARLLGLIK